MPASVAEAAVTRPDICDASAPAPSGTDGICDDICEAHTHPTSGKVKLRCDLCSLREHGVTPHDDAVGVAVYNHLLGVTGSLCSKEYCIWGVDVEGTAFVCEYDTFGGDLEAIELVGGEADDKLFFWFSTPSNPSTDFILKPYNGTVSFAGVMDGEGGSDELQASPATDSNYAEMAWGGTDADRICTLDGDDQGHGEGGDDQVDCGPGANLCTGGNGYDEVCSGGTVSTLTGGPDDDWLFSGATSSTVAGGTGYDYCTPATDPSCESPASTCPW
jgi:hypothetical protein